MYQSSDRCVLIALNSALLARLMGRLQRYEPNGESNVEWRRDLRGLFMACDMDEITDVSVLFSEPKIPQCCWLRRFRGVWKQRCGW